jgi:hypothetical protein
MGAVEGATIGHIVSGQIGRRSIELSQSGSISPSTHWQMHSACVTPTPNKISSSASRNARMARPLEPIHAH